MVARMLRILPALIFWGNCLLPLYSMAAASETQCCPAPILLYAAPAGKHFDSSITITLVSDPQATVYYTLDGTTPNEKGVLYSIPFQIFETATLRAIAVRTPYMSTAFSERYTKNPMEKVDAKIWFTDEDGKILADGTIWSLQQSEVYLTLEDDFAQGKISTIQVAMSILSTPPLQIQSREMVRIGKL